MVHFIQNHLLSGSWQEEAVYKTIRYKLINYKNILVYKDYIDLKNNIYASIGLNNAFILIEAMKDNIDNDTRIITIETNIFPEKECKILFINAYMCIFDKGIIGLEYTKGNVRSVIKMAYALFDDVISKELDINKPETDKKGFIDSILNFFNFK